MKKERLEIETIASKDYKSKFDTQRGKFEYIIFLEKFSPKFHQSNILKSLSRSFVERVEESVNYSREKKF